jgi:hypothetical protein
MTDDQSRTRLGMAVLNGIILGLIGILIVITPLTTDIPKNQLGMDLVAGSILILGGAASLVWGLTHG